MREHRASIPADRLRAQRGASGIKLIISLVVLALIVHVAYVFIPIYVAVYDFDSQVEKEASYGSGKPNEAIAKDLMQYAAERGLKVTKESLRVSRGASRLTIEAHYTVPVKTLVYTYNWEISVEKQGVLF